MGGFVDALLAVQRHGHIANAAVAGILRDRGLCSFVRSEFLLDETLSLQKIVLLSLSRLKELGVEYCKYLRKSEDLALCYDVVQRQGGHVLKVQSYCYKALHLQAGGAEVVRLDCSRNRVATVSELVHGGDLTRLSPAHQKVANALLEWQRHAQGAGVDVHGDRRDLSEDASPVLWRHLAKAGGVQALQPTGWLERLPKMRRRHAGD